MKGSPCLDSHRMFSTHAEDSQSRIVEGSAKHSRVSFDMSRGGYTVFA